MAALMGSPLVGAVGVIIAALSIADVWQLLHSC